MTLEPQQIIGQALHRGHMPISPQSSKNLTHDFRIGDRMLAPQAFDQRDTGSFDLIVLKAHGSL
jgi:hypothetical protein